MKELVSFILLLYIVQASQMVVYFAFIFYCSCYFISLLAFSEMHWTSATSSLYVVLFQVLFHIYAFSPVSSLGKVTGKYYVLLTLYEVFSLCAHEARYHAPTKSYLTV